ncbi:hypothetical protein CR152_27685 [Massilia violaceinigra]|uniref:Uncharacterized protein n=1 Tax=Massilia violaceinigra TaxID=2045208 RepID=A0A2D2DSA4_9BURK|nr:hypothetical protein [Massilia violaceinigra]ATQ77862.1 hypothetical protein CR152_27685 [Massilia violaceinigra]
MNADLSKLTPAERLALSIAGREDCHMSMVSVANVRAVLARIAELETIVGDSTADAPTTAQDWAGLSAEVAYSLIERHADTWAKGAQMMTAWADARAAAGAPDLHSAMDEREAFEKYMTQDDAWPAWPKAVERSGKGYKLMQVQSAWVAWQARAALESAAPVEALTDEEILIIAAETEHGWSGGELGQIIPFGIEESESEPYINFARAIEARIMGGAK